MQKYIKLITIILLFTSYINAQKSILIDLTTQQAYAYEDGNLVMSGEVSTGKVGHRTPKGTFRILEKDLRHTSSKYPEPNGGARMDYMMRLTNSGVAMHLGFVPNYPASHGCIRLKNGFAQRLYSWAKVGTKVVIEGNPPLRVTRAKAPRVVLPKGRELPKTQIKQYQKSNRYGRYREYRQRGKRVARRRVLVFDDMQDSRYPQSQRVYPRAYKNRTRADKSSYRYDVHNGKIYTRKIIHFDDLPY